MEALVAFDACDNSADDEFLSPLHAQIQYGIGGNTANGVVVVYTRGKGPYASPLRNRER